MPFGGLRQSGNGWREAGHRGARRLLGLEDGLHQPRPRYASERRVPSAVALIPARAGLASGCPARTSAQLDGHPLLAYTIAAAQRVGLFDAVVVSTDSRGDRRGRAPLRRRGAVPAAGRAGRRDRRPDIDWVEHTLDALRATGGRATASPAAADQPVPTAATIRAARGPAARGRRRRLAARRREVRAAPGQDVGASTAASGCARCSTHGDGVPLHSHASTRRCRAVYVQNSSSRSPGRASRSSGGTIAGERDRARSRPRGRQGFSIDYPRRLVDVGRASLLGERGRCPQIHVEVACP